MRKIVTIRMARVAVLTLLVAVACGCTEADFHPYSGAQGSNPTAVGSFIDTKYAVPVYYGYPPRGYRVLGEMEPETRGRFRNALAAAANRAPQYGADAIIVLSHEHHGEGAVGVGQSWGSVTPGQWWGGGTAFMAPIRVDQARVIFIKWL